MSVLMLAARTRTHDEKRHHEIATSPAFFDTDHHGAVPLSATIDVVLYVVKRYL